MSTVNTVNTVSSETTKALARMWPAIPRLDIQVPDLGQISFLVVGTTVVGIRLRPDGFLGRSAEHQHDTEDAALDCAALRAARVLSIFPGAQLVS